MVDLTKRNQANLRRGDVLAALLLLPGVFHCFGFVICRCVMSQSPPAQGTVGLVVSWKLRIAYVAVPCLLGVRRTKFRVHVNATA